MVNAMDYDVFYFFCKNEVAVERKRCKECVKIFNRARVKKYHKKDKVRYGIIDCSVCGEKLTKGRPNQVAHGKCRRKTVEDYNNVPRSKSYNTTVARQMVLDLGFILSSNLVVHHVDENPFNNHLNNFWVISRSKHNSLHRFLQQQWSLFKKLDSSNLENCWDNLRGQLTTTWLETTGVNVVKITDIGQSAAEPLNENNIYVFLCEEGSETMYQVP